MRRKARSTRLRRRRRGRRGGGSCGVVRWDDGCGAAGDWQAAKRIAVIGAVCGERGGSGQQGDQVCRDRRIAALAGRDGEGDQPSPPVDQCVQPGRRIAARAAYGVGMSPPLPPAARRCALAQVPSSISSLDGPPAASVSNARCHTPFFAHLTQWLYSVFFGPWQAGASTQRPSLISTCTMPEITRRSSTRAPPPRVGRQQRRQPPELLPTQPKPCCHSRSPPRA